MLSPTWSPRMEDAPVGDEVLSSLAKESDEVNVEFTDDAHPEREDENEDNCSICLHPVVDRTVIPKCSHEFCFECLLVWTEQSRRCPLCSQTIGDYLIHSIRSRYDYRKHFLPPLRTSPPPARPTQNTAILHTTRQNARRRRREREWGTRDRENEEFDKLERSIAKRRWIYQHNLYAKHVASNAYTKYRPYPTPAQFSASQDLISRTTTFLRRELQVWEGLDVEFLTTLIISLMKSIDIRSESAVKLISEFLDMDVPYESGGRHTNAEHFAHEVYCYVRSPYRDLFVYDSIVQYDAPAEVPPPLNIERSRRWRPGSPPLVLEGASSSQEAIGPHERRLRSRSRSSERSTFWSPSGRRFPSTTNRGGNNNNDAEGSKKGIVGESSQHLVNSHRQNRERKYTADEHISDRRRESCNENSTAASSSEKRNTLSSSETDRHMALPSEDRSAKGKQRSYGKEPTTNAEPTVSKSSENCLDEQSECDTLSVESTPQIIDHKVEDTQLTSEHLAQQRLRVPRNRSLLDSVRAHLAGNISTSLAGKESSASFDQSRRAQEQVPLPQESAHLQNNSHVNSRVTNNDAPKSQERNIHGVDNCLSQHTLDSEQSLPKTNITSLSTTTHGKAFGDTHSVTPAQVPRIGAPQTTSEPCDVMITSENSIADTVSPIPNVINDGSGSTSSSYVFSDVRQTSSRIQSSSKKNGFSSKDVALKSKLGEQAGLPIETQISIHDAEQFLHVLSAPARDDISIRNLTHSNFVSNVNQDQSRPHATLNSEEARTRLLARLEFEKKQACLLGHAAENPILRVDSDSAVSLGSTFMSSSNSPSERVSAASDAGHGYAHNDTTSSSTAVSEEAAAQEAKLRSRAQLRVRLAAEKRLVHGD